MAVPQAEHRRFLTLGSAAFPANVADVRTPKGSICPDERSEKLIFNRNV
jgi:hypothetical protein